MARRSTGKRLHGVVESSRSGVATGEDRKPLEYYAHHAGVSLTPKVA